MRPESTPPVGDTKDTADSLALDVVGVPGAYQDENTDTIVLQGRIVPAGESGREVPPGESLVILPLDILRQAAGALGLSDK